MTLAICPYFNLRHKAPYLLLISFLFFALGCRTGTALKASGHSPLSSDNTKVQAPVEAGLWPMTQLEGPVMHYLKSEGMALSAQQIYSEEGPSLSGAIVRIQFGERTLGTGSFVSGNGLILTDRQHTLQILRSGGPLSPHTGFHAASRAEEIPARGYRLHILIEQKDITGEIAQRIPEGASYGQKVRYQQQVRKQLISERKQGQNDLMVEVKDIWAGNKQLMMVYKVITDLRLVHSPPVSVPGSEKFKKTVEPNSNYAFFRAYDSDGRPYNPDQYLKITRKKPVPGDLSLTLNFPASTYRYESSYALGFYHNVLNPVLIESQQSILEALNYTAEHDGRKTSSNIAKRSSLSSSQNYYQAVAKGINQLDMIAEKKSKEEELEIWIKEQPQRSFTYRKINEQLEQSYSIASQSADLLYATLYPLNNNLLIQIAGLYAPYYEYVQHPDSLSFTSKQKQQLLQKHRAVRADMDLTSQTLMLKNMVTTLATLPDGKIPFFLLDFFDPYDSDSLEKSISNFIESLEANSIIFDLSKAESLLALTPTQAQSQAIDPLVSFFVGLQESYNFASQNYQKHFPYVVPARRRYVKALKEFRDYPLDYPDANGTLRFSVGRVSNTVKSDTVDIMWIRTTNNGTSGSFGGPLLNHNGKLIGMTVNKRADTAIDDYLLGSKGSTLDNVSIHYVIHLIEKMDTGKVLLEELRQHK